VKEEQEAEKIKVASGRKYKSNGNKNDGIRE
jgi:hypothetical protein